MEQGRCILYEDIIEIKERLARLEEKVDWLIKTRNSNDKWYKVIFSLWLSFISVLLAWIALVR